MGPRKLAIVLIVTILTSCMAFGQLTDRKALTLTAVKKMLAAAEAEAVKNNVNVSMAVIDDGGHLLGFEKMDGAGPITINVAIGKARTAANFGSPSADAEGMIGKYPGLMNAPDMMPLRGGVPVVVDGVVIGAVGASGATSELDEQIAKAGAAVANNITVNTAISQLGKK